MGSGATPQYSDTIIHMKKIISLFAVIATVLSLSACAPSQNDLLDSATLAGEYLIRSVDEDGKFIYQYDPTTDQVANKYNILRHAGTIYSMLELYEVTQNEELLEAAERALAYLAQQIEPCEAKLPDSACLIERGYTKIGGNGLAIVAIAQYAEVTDDEKYIPTAQALARFIVSNQSKEGEFWPHKIAFPSMEADDFVSEYYPGEALLALNRLYELDGNQEWITAAHNGINWLIEVRDKGKSTKKLPHDHWLLYAMYDQSIHEKVPASFVDHAMKIVDSILDMQKEGGNYYTPPRSTPTATRSEGLYAAYKLALDNKYEDKTEDIFNGIELGIGFQLQTQFTKGPAIGAFHEGPENTTVRIDYVQHNISSILGYIELLKLRKDEN
jgi:hypothetical protein